MTGFAFRTLGCVSRYLVNVVLREKLYIRSASSSSAVF